MNITREDMPGRQVALTIDLDPETVNTALERAYRQMVNQVDIPGFRRGKAPRYLVERYLGKEYLTERAVRNILPDTVQNAISEQNIEAMDVGDVEIVSMDPVQVRVIIVQPPIVKLGDYGSIRVEKDPVEVTPEQVEEVMTELRRESAPWQEPAEPRPLKEGDMVYLDLEGFTSEGELEEAKRENFPTIVGLQRGGVPDAVNKALEGMSVGEENDIADTLPEDYPNEALRGHEVTYHVTIRSMKEQQLPELNDEFAKSLSYDSVDALREAVEKNLRSRAEEASTTKQVEEATRQLVEGSTVEMPHAMIHEELESMLKRLEARLKEQRITLKQYFTYNGITQEEWEQANHEQAEKRVINSQVLLNFAVREGIEVSDAEVQAEIESVLGQFEGKEKEQAEQVFAKGDARENVEDRLFQRKIIDRLVGIAEGRIEAAPAPAEEEASEASPVAAEEETTEAATPEAPEGATAEAADETAVTNEAQSPATALEDAGGAAEVLGTAGVDTQSPNETGEAAGGGTPDAAPGLESGSEK